MAIQLFRDDNGVAVQGGLRHAGIVSATLSGTVQALTIPAGGQNKDYPNKLARIVATEPAFYALGPAGATFTDITDMVYLPANTVEIVKVENLDTKVYVLQAGTAGSFQLTTLK